MSLRARLNLIVGTMMAAFIAIVMAIDLTYTRAAIHEEIQASHRIALQLIREVSGGYAQGDAAALVAFLTRVGRVRANDITLTDTAGQQIYRSPASTYKAGRDAPAWYAGLVMPRFEAITLPLANGTLTLTPDASRATLDGWDDMRTQLLSAALLLLAANLAVFYGVSRSLSPLRRIRQGMERFGAGHADERLPPLPATDMRDIGRAFNQMADDIATHQQWRIAAAQTETRLLAEQEFVQKLQEKIEDERRELATELHDELGQQLTGIRALGSVVVQRTQTNDGQTAHAATLMLRSAEQMQDAINRIVPRLRPPALDRLGLIDAVDDLVSALRERHSTVQFVTQCGTLPTMPDAVKIAAYRIVQESLTNIVRHAQATVARVTLHADDRQLTITVSDDGVGLPQDPRPAGGHGLHGIDERVRRLNGSVQWLPAAHGGLTVTVCLPLVQHSAQDTSSPDTIGRQIDTPRSDDKAAT